ncbi:MAG: hypothetical protein H7641_02155 [Candidatus Heimdallarchaeota archaeon]|nr:hypothetical protein [Candidatus Heimdallarchaeota archaeon]MCK4876367.1 hypothetical protein [Candidatus Heimdallarchaeota archaeon]
MISNNKMQKFVGSNKSIYTIKRNKDFTVYAAFIIKPFKQIEEDIKQKKNWFYSSKEEKEKPNPLLSVLNEVKMLNISLHRMFIPGNVRKKENVGNAKNQKNTSSSLLNELFEDDNQDIDVSLSFFILKVWKSYDLSSTFESESSLIDDFISHLRNELKQKLEGVGKVGRVLGDTLEELVRFSTLNHSNFLSKGNKVFSGLTKDFAFIEKSEEFQRSFQPGPSVDKRPDSIFSFPSGIEANSSLLVGLTESDFPVGLPKEPSFPILIAGDNKTREIITSKLLEQNGKFIILDPRTNLEFENRIKADFTSLNLGENFSFNVLTPVTNKNYISEQISNQYLGNFIEIIRSITDVRSDAAALLRDLIDFYINEYQEEQEDVLFPRHDTPVSLDDLYSMLTIEPGGLVITDYQLSTVRALINDIRDPSISENTRINDVRGIEELFTNNMIINFSSQGYKVQKLFIYSFLLQLTVIDQVMNIDEDILIYIDDAELFFSKDIDKTILSHILKKLENSPFKIIFSTPYPSHLSSKIFDLTHNRIIGNLKSANCLKLISRSHGLDKGQFEFIRRLPKNNLLLVREDLMEKPLLLRFFPEDVERYETQSIRPNQEFHRNSKTLKTDDEILTVNIDDFSSLHPIMLEILGKLSTKVNRGINSESLSNLFINWEKDNVKEAISVLETFGYIFFETVDKKGKKGEYWTKITPRGKRFHEKLKFTKVIDVKNKEVENGSVPDEAKQKRILDVENVSDFIESPSIKISTDDSSLIVKKIQKQRKKVRETRDSEKKQSQKLEILNSTLIQVKLLLNDRFEEEVNRLENFLTALSGYLEEDNSLKELPREILESIFRKALSLIDAIQIKSTFGESSTNSADDEFIEKVIEKELSSDKWQDFDREVFLTEIPELSSLSKNQKKITKKLSSELPDDILQGLELGLDLTKDEFVKLIRKAIASLLQIKTMFYPNMDSEKYLEEVNIFFEEVGYPEPFEKSKQLLWEYTSKTKEKEKKALSTYLERREIIESIQEESESFEFDLEGKSKDSLVSQLIQTIRKKIKND